MRIALIQMKIEVGRRSANLARALDRIDRACDQDPAPDLVVLPEGCDIGCVAPDSLEIAEPVGGPHAESLAATAREMGVHLVAGLTELDGQALYSAAVLFDADGDVLLRHRKIGVSAPLRDVYAPGDRLRVGRTLWGGIGLALSGDLEMPCLTDALAAMGAGIIVSPSAWLCEPGQEEVAAKSARHCLASRAASTSVYVVSVNGVGEIESGVWKGRSLIGGSAVYAPDGQALCTGPSGQEAILTVEIPAWFKKGTGSEPDTHGS